MNLGAGGSAKTARGRAPWLSLLPAAGGVAACALALASLGLVDHQLRQAEEARALDVASRDLAMLPSSAATLGPGSTSALRVAVETHRALIEAASAGRAPDGAPSDPCAALGRDPSVIAGLPLRPDLDAGGSTAPFGSRLKDSDAVRAATADLAEGERRIVRFNVALPPQCDAGPQAAIGRAMRVGDVILVAGRLIDPGGRTRGVLVSIGLVSLSLALLGTVIAVVLIGRRTQRRLEILRDALRAAASGDFDARVAGRAGRGAMGVLGDEIDRAIERIERLNHGFREMATKVAHDFRTPLTKARLQLELGLRRGGDQLGAAASKAIEQIDDLAAGFASHLDMARTLGGEAVKFQAFDLLAVARRVGELQEDTPAAIAHLVTVEVEGEAIVAMGLERQVETALANLVSNAIKASPNGGTVRIVVGRGRSDEAIIEVSDQGPGWPSDLADRLGAFGARGRPEDPESHGVGLAAVLAVARLHGGRLDRLPAPSGGALARLVLVGG